LAWLQGVSEKCRVKSRIRELISEDVERIMKNRDLAQLDGGL